MEFKSLFLLPAAWTSTETTLWVFRLLGALTFIVWPGVLVASIMAAAAHVAVETPWTSFVRFLWLASIGYPMYFMALWVWANRLKESSPMLAIFFTALPALLVYGFSAKIYLEGKWQEKRTAERVTTLREEVRENLHAQNYAKAFEIFLNPDRSADSYLLEQSKAPGFDFATEVETSLSAPPSRVLVEHLLRYASPSITGTLAVHWSYLDPNDPIEPTDQSERVLRLLQKWRYSGLNYPGLSTAHQWIWNNLELFTDWEKDLSARKFLQKENPFLLEYAGLFGTPEELTAMIQRYPEELRNKRISRFGTPVNALILDEMIDPSPRKRERIKILRDNGGRLHADEETEEKLELLKSI